MQASGAFMMILRNTNLVENSLMIQLGEIHIMMCEIVGMMAMNVLSLTRMVSLATQQLLMTMLLMLVTLVSCWRRWLK